MDDNQNIEYLEKSSTDSNVSSMETSDLESDEVPFPTWDDEEPLTTWDGLALKLPFIKWLNETLNLPDNGNYKLRQVELIVERQYGPVWLLNSMFDLIGKLEAVGKEMYDRENAEALNETPPPI